MISLNNHWKKLLETPREEVRLFCTNLLFFMLAEESKANKQAFEIKTSQNKLHLGDKRIVKEPDDIPKAFIGDRMMIFLYESIEANCINNKVTKIIGGEEFYKAFQDYMGYLYSEFYLDDPVWTSEKYSQEQVDIILYNYTKAKEKFTGYVNPKEVIHYFYSLEIGQEFLPPSLIKFLDTKYKKKTSIKNKHSNRTGSVKDTDMHDKTKLACEKALAKVQQDKILCLTRDKFTHLVQTFMGINETAVSTVLRKFYRFSVGYEYKRGRGRPTE